MLSVSPTSDPEHRAADLQELRAGRVHGLKFFILNSLDGNMYLFLTPYLAPLHYTTYLAIHIFDAYTFGTSSSLTALTIPQF